jgi:hypothetical protein
MIPKQSPAVDPLTPEAPSLTDAMPTPAAPAPTPAPTPATATLRCIQRPTGEWFTFAAGNAPGKDTPDATELLTEAQARDRLQALSLAAPAVEARIVAARANAEVTGDELPLPDPVVGGPAPPSE